MVRFVLKRLLVIPFALMLVHFLGFGYAHFVRPLRAERNPFLASAVKTEPLIPVYTDYIKSVLGGDYGEIVNPQGDATPERSIK